MLFSRAAGFEWQIRNYMGKADSLRLIALIILGFIAFLFILTHAYGGYLYTFTIPIVWNVLIRNKNFSSIGIAFNDFKKSVLWGIMSSLALSLICALILNLFNIHKVELSSLSSDFDKLLVNSADGYLLKQSHTVKGQVYYFLYMILGVGIGEEIFWRGFIQNKLGRKFSKRKAIFLTTILFMLIHVYILMYVPLKFGAVFLGMVGIASIIWGWLFFCFENILAAGLSHGITAFIVWRCLFFEI